MKKLFILFVFLLIYGCSKPKTVLICGDHVCINKAEAEQYFEENLTLEVRVVDSKKSKEINLVELNLESNSKGKKEISILSKKQTSKKVKKLSKTEIRKKKAQLKKRKNEQTKKKQNAKTKKNKKKKIIKQVELKKSRSEAKTSKNILKRKRIVNKPKDEIIDICTIIKKCSIEEISKYLVKEGKNKKFPDITTREN
tara:strand:+ start:671 stop:1261 length:591 start_codon:yes stop_codon:yes gene_type:complete